TPQGFSIFCCDGVLPPQTPVLRGYLQVPPTPRCPPYEGKDDSNRGVALKDMPFPRTVLRWASTVLETRESDKPSSAHRPPSPEAAGSCFPSPCPGIRRSRRPWPR